ncbi:hypothetical protein Vadar_029602 [Vaccinium darrowii]|uniref:Uncharacterized protein n=1 Tax=Vaccinium darrowii TaxID=229202 RepID=A0ACB7X4Z6_9ERIC|nr:hypothetical protein Vadar_029602 [Vaccinium darrowii]
MEMKHFAHQHPLTLLNEEEERYCFGCRNQYYSVLLVRVTSAKLATPSVSINRVLNYPPRYIGSPTPITLSPSAAG